MRELVLFTENKDQASMGELIKAIETDQEKRTMRILRLEHALRKIMKDDPRKWSQEQYDFHMGLAEQALS